MNVKGEMVNLSEKIGEGETEIPTVEEEDVGLLEESIAPRKNLPPLLLELGNSLYLCFLHQILNLKGRTFANVCY